MLLFTTSSSMIVYAQLGDIPWDYAGVLLVVAFVTTILGQVLIDHLINKVGRSSIIVVVLACFFMVACVLTCFIMITSLQHVAIHPAELWVVGHVCQALT